MRNLIRTLDKTFTDVVPKTYPEFFDDFFYDFHHKELDDRHELFFSLPGFKKDEIFINVNGSYLDVSAEKKQKEEFSFFRSQFKRQIFIGNFDPQLIEASLEDGILKITVPLKKKEGIEIKVK